MNKRDLYLTLAGCHAGWAFIAGPGLGFVFNLGAVAFWLCLADLEARRTWKR